MLFVVDDVGKFKNLPRNFSYATEYCTNIQLYIHGKCVIVKFFNNDKLCSISENDCSLLRNYFSNMG